MQMQKNYYEVLGLPRSASKDQIKHRYRELARKYHPDVAENKNVGHKPFMQITEAYRTLVDADKRSDYDAAHPAPSSGVTTGGRSQSAHDSAGGNGCSSSPAVDNLIRDAQFSVVKRRYAEAVDLCRRALQTEATNATIHAILGDAYRGLGETDLAIKAYGMAVHYNPEDQESKIKRENLIKRGNTNVPRAGQANKPGTPSSASQKSSSDSSIVGKLGALFRSKRQKD